jgi:ubiquinone/menaquinone biosynthesis C-methylase UbiE
MRARISRHEEPTRWLRSHYDRAAAGYDKKLSFFDRTLFAGGREWVCGQAAGETLEIAIGTGLNLPHYRPQVKLTGVDLSPAMIELARRRASDLGRRVVLQVADAEQLPFPGGSFDTVVSTLSLCTIPDDFKAVAEVYRVLRPEGRFVLMEHVRSPNTVVRLGQLLAEQLTLRLEGDHQLRDPATQLVTAGFLIDRLERSKWGLVARIAARKPPPADS